MKLYFGRDILDSALDSLKGNRMVIVADRAVQHRLLGEVIAIAPEKSSAAKERLEERLFAAGVGRDTVLVGMGGGTTTDLVGFVASTYMRGIPLILVPTTLLAMVDAAIGGKTAIDTSFGKNLIGTFYVPEAIIVDLTFLQSLPEEEIVNGRSEIVKIGLVYDPSILRMSGDEQIHRAIQTKIEIVDRDPKEGGLRRILNFGHTVGHAVEHCSGMAHGKAVALGCIAESYLSLLMGFLSWSEFEQIVQMFPKYKWVFDPSAMRLDKKRGNGVIRFVLLSKIGATMSFNGDYCAPVPQDKINEMIRWMEANYG